MPETPPPARPPSTKYPGIPADLDPVADELLAHMKAQRAESPAPLTPMPPFQEGDVIAWTRNGQRRTDTIPRQMLDWANAALPYSLIDTIERDGVVIWRREP